MEEAPCPSFAGETPKPFYMEAIDEKDRIISESKTVDVEFNNNKYILELGKSENNKNIIFKMSHKKSHNLSKYTAYINFNQFNNINYIFSFYNNLNEIYALLITNLNEKKFSISIKDDRYVITFNFLMPGDKLVNVDFYLKEEKISNSMVLNDVFTLVDKLEEENNKFKEEINLLKAEDKKLKDELDNKNNEIIYLKNEVNQIKKENEIIKEKMKFFEDKLNNLSNNIINNVNIKHEKINRDNNIEKNNKIKNEININNKPKYECDSIPNYINSSDNNSINKSQNNIPKNIIIDEDEEEEIKEKENNNKNEIKTYISNNTNNLTKEDNKINNSEKIKTQTQKTQIKKTPNIENINFDTLFSYFKIISNKKEKQSLYNWLSIKGGNIKEIKLIFQASQDGDEYDKFFSKCGDKGPTLSLIKSKNNKKFGGFTKANWTDKKGKIKIKDESAFIFSLNKLKKYDVLQSDIAIACYPDGYLLMYGNNFDRYGLRIYSGFLEKGNYENFKNKSYDTNDPFCLSGENEFYVDELEVFLIIFE